MHNKNVDPVSLPRDVLVAKSKWEGKEWRQMCDVSLEIRFAIHMRAVKWCDMNE